MDERLFILLFFYLLFEVRCGYPPIGDEVQAGSVLLPASRRGRYLANIVRRQAVDGTGIKFNKDADRMNAEAKKKVDVLSEELLPYIIAEQERRTTLYKRVMTAIQNGEKGVTIAEIRNKPPAIIRKGLMYRCPTNRAPKEPDGSGVIMCEDNIEPTPIMYDSCLSAEDRELYVAENKYFFCNRHKVEGPDLPRNGTTVIGCSPCERTSLNYTSAKCALEDTDDVVVHYRYYPDRTYKFVTELDPDREVCEHWNPCQIGYIFSLPSPDQASPASELWHDAVLVDGDYEAEEFVPPVPEDTIKQFVKPPVNETSKMTIPIPEGMQYSGVGKYLPRPGGGPKHKEKISTRDGVLPQHQGSISVSYQEDPVRRSGVEVSVRYIRITIIFTPLNVEDIGLYFARFDNISDPKQLPKLVELVEYEEAKTDMAPTSVLALPGQRLNQTQITMSCERCSCKVIMLRADDGSIRNLETSKFNVHKTSETHAILTIDINTVTYQDYGEYFAHITLADGGEERLKVLTIKLPDPDEDNVLQVKRMQQGATVGQPFNQEVDCKCEDCEVLALECNGENMMQSRHITVVKKTSLVFSFNFPSFEDANACVYTVTFQKGDKTYKSTIAVIENDSQLVKVPAAKVIPPPAEGEPFEQEITYECTGECALEKVMLDGVPLITNTRRSDLGAIPFIVPGDHKFYFRITKFMPMLMGVEQAVFLVDGEPITKTVLEIGKPSDSGSGSEETETGASTEAGEGAETGGSSEGAPGEEQSTEPVSGDPSGEPSDNPAGVDEVTEDAASETPGRSGPARQS